MNLLPLTHNDPEHRATNLHAGSCGALCADCNPMPLSQLEATSLERQIYPRNCLLRLPGGTLGVCSPDGSMLDFPAGLTDILDLGEGRFMAHRADGSCCPVLYSCDTDSYSALTDIHRLPPVRFRPLTHSPLSATVASRTLSGDYSLASGLEADHVRQLSRDMGAAYSEVCARCDAMGLFVQPVIIRYRLLDSRNRDIFVSPPVLISASGAGQQTSQTATLMLGKDDKGRTVLSEYSLGLTPFSICATIPAALCEAWRGFLGGIAIEVSPQLSAIDPERDCSYSMNPRTEAQRTLTLSLPGSEAAASLFSRAVAAAVDQFGSICRTLRFCNLASVSGDLNLDDMRLTDRLTAAARFALICRICARTDLADTAVRSLSLPHIPAAEAVAVSSQAMLMGGLSAFPFAGYTPDYFCCADDLASSLPCRMAALVEFADGSSVVSSTVISGATPVSLSPLLSYPRHDAVRITIIGLFGGICKRFVFDLTPTPGHTAACWINPSGADLPLAEAGERVTSFIVPAASPVRSAFPGLCLCSPAGNPLAVTSSAHVCAGAIRAVSHAGKRSAFNESPRFLLFADEGIFSVAVSLRRSLPIISGSKLIDRRPVCGSRAVTSDSGKVYALCGGDLLSICGDSVDTLYRSLLPSGTEAAAAVDPSGRLIISLPSSLITYSLADRTFAYHTASDGHIPIYRGILSCGARCLAFDTADGWLYDLRRSAPAAMIPLRFWRMIELKSIGIKSSRRLAVHLVSSRFEGEIALYMSTGPGPCADSPDAGRTAFSQPLAAIRVSGTVRAPLFLRFRVLRMCHLRLHISALAACDTVISKIELL